MNLKIAKMSWTSILPYNNYVKPNNNILCKGYFLLKKVSDRINWFFLKNEELRRIKEFWGNKVNLVKKL